MRYAVIHSGNLRDSFNRRYWSADGWQNSLASSTPITQKQQQAFRLLAKDYWVEVDYDSEGKPRRVRTVKNK